MKLVIFLGIVHYRGVLGEIGESVLYPLDEYPRIELILVMVLVPLIVNVLQFWIQDNFLKLKAPVDCVSRVLVFLYS